MLRAGLDSRGGCLYMICMKSEARLVTLEQLVTALLAAVENPADALKVVGVTKMRSGSGVKTLAGSGVQRHPSREVTLQTKVIA